MTGQTTERPRRIGSVDIEGQRHQMYVELFSNGDICVDQVLGETSGILILTAKESARLRALLVIAEQKASKA